ncbi:hypothetical protein QYS60_22660 [Rhodococcus sp. GXMU-t2271]|uniref:hypothetical protein n=1 Tax=Rhodococcus sp. GXMU-t2271 TaxID=3059079 RepID=UPI00352A6356
MTGRFERIVAEHREAVACHLEVLRRVRDPLEPGTGTMRAPEPSGEEQFYRPRSWLI